MTREVEPDRAQLVDETVVAPRRVGLTLQRGQAAPHLAQEVVESEEVPLRRLEAALRLLATLAVLQDAGGLLDDEPSVLGARVEHGVELTLTDDSGQVVLRKVLSPEQLGLPLHAPGHALLTCHNRWQLDPELAARVSGFRIELFYP